MFETSVGTRVESWVDRKLTPIVWGDDTKWESRMLVETGPYVEYMRGGFS